MTDKEYLIKNGYIELAKHTIYKIKEWMIEHPDSVWDKTEREIRYEIDTYFSDFVDDTLTEEEAETLYYTFGKVIGSELGYDISVDIFREIREVAAEYEEFCREREREYLSMV